MRRLMCCFATLCMVLTMIFPSVSVEVSAQEAVGGEVTLRVGTWNIAAKNHPDVKELSKVISDNQIEIAGVQEVDVNNSRNNYDMMAAFESEALPYIHFAKGRDYSGGDFGIGIVSQYPLLETSTSPLETFDLAATKVMERVLIEKEGKQIAVYNIHLSVDQFGSLSPRDLRQIQIAQIVERIKQDPIEYKILLGDFNSDQDRYEFSRLLDLFDLSNGKNGEWIDTYHENDDPNMKVFSIDNILVTKNIRVDYVGIVENELSDHYLLLADVTLLDEQAPQLKNNLALGAEIEATQADEGTSAYALVDHLEEKGWTCNADTATITLKLDHTVKNAVLKLIWGEQKASDYEISISSNGKNWTRLEAIPTESLNLGTTRYVKIDLLAKESAVYDLREIEITGTFDASLDEKEQIETGNIVENGSFENWATVAPVPGQPAGTWWDTDIWENNEKTAPWIYQIYQGTAAMSDYYCVYKDADEKIDGNYSVRVEKKEGAGKDAFFKLQNHPFTNGQTYLVSFWYKTQGIADNALILSMFGETKLPSVSEWTYFEKEFTANKAKETVNIRLNGSNIGVYWLDDFQINPKVEVEQPIIKAEMLSIKAEKTNLLLGENETLQAVITPFDAEDQVVEWASSDSKIVSVDAQGTVNAVDRGTAIITATLVSQPLMKASVLLTVSSSQVETSKLEEAVKAAEMKNADSYTEISWNRFESALQRAKEALAAQSLDQTEIDLAYEALIQAGQLLVRNKVEDQEDFYAIMRDYWVKEMVGMDPDYSDEQLLQAVSAQDKITEHYLKTMNDLSDSSIKTVWSDAELLANTGGAEVTVMLDRLKIMAIQTQSPLSQYYQDKEAIQKIMDAIEFTVKKRYNKNTGSTSNWWDAEIGTPKVLVDLTLIYYEEFLEENPQLIQDVCEAIDKHIPYANHRGTSITGLTETGANLIDKVAIVLKRSLLDQNHERLTHAKECMAPLFTLVSSGDGFYKDGSFVFHTSIAYNGSYGAVLIDELVNCIALLSYSDIPVGKNELSFINDQVIHAYFPFITYGGNIVDSVRGRAIARIAQQGDTMGSKVMGTLLQYADIADEKTASIIYSTIKTILKQKNAHEVTQDISLLNYSDVIRLNKLVNSSDVVSATIEDSYLQFSYMNKAVAKRSDYTFALSMSSNRIYNTETGNTENTRGYYQGQGMTQIYTTDVNQYNEDYWALVDPYRLPGVTTAHQNLASGTAGQSSWAGGSTLDGVNGVSGQIISPSKTLNNSQKSGIAAYKSWFVLDNRIVAVGSDISSSNTSVSEVETILDNRRISLEAVLKDLNGKVYEGDQVSDAKGFLLTDKQNSMGYLILDENQAHVLTEQREGTWYEVNQLGKFTDHTLRTAKFASLAISHGASPTASGYQFMIVPNADEAEMQSLMRDPGIEIIQASEGIHALKDLHSNQEYYNFFVAGNVGDITVSAPVSMTLQRTSSGVVLAVADPTRTCSSVDVTFDQFDVQSAGIIEGDAIIKAKEGNRVTITVNFDVKDGLSRRVQLEAEFAVSSDNYALRKPVSASSVVQNANTANRQPEFAVDGSLTGNFWASEYLLGGNGGTPDISLSDAWFMVDLGEVKEINQVKIYWDTGSGKRYDIQVSETGEEGSFKTVYEFSAEPVKVGTKRTDTLNFDPINARYVRMKGIARSSEDWSSNPLRAGYTILEFEVRNTLSVRASLKEAREVLELYPRDTMSNLSDEEYNEIYEAVQKAILNAENLMGQGANAEEEQLRSAVEELDAAIRNYKSKIVPVVSIEMDLTELYVNKYDIFTLTPKILPENASLKEYTLVSSDENIVEIREDGSLFAAKAGCAIITAISKDGNFRASTQVVVSVAPERIEISAEYLVLKKDQSTKLTTSILPADTTVALSVSYASSDDSVVSVDQNGTLQALRKGTAIITVSVEEIGLSAQCKVDVELDYTAQSENLALNQDAEASSVVQNANTANRIEKWAVDGDPTTRWASEYLLDGKEDPSFDQGWFTVDLKEVTEINKVVLLWETSKAKDYDLQGSLDGEIYFTLYEYRSDDQSTGDRTDELVFDKTEVRYVRMQGIDRSTNYNSSRGGYSLYEFEIYNTKDYFTIMEESRMLMVEYPSQTEEFDALKRKVEEVDALVSSEDFNSSALYDLLCELDKAKEAYSASIIHVEEVQIRVDQSSLLVNETTEIHVSVLPENAFKSDYILSSSDESIIQIRDHEIVAVNPGKAVITVISQDGNHRAEIELTVRKNSLPVISGSDITISLYHDFDPTTGVKAYDEEDGELALTLVSSDLNTHVPGVYKIVFEATDSDGNTVSWTRRVTVEITSQSISTIVVNGVRITGPLDPKQTVQVSKSDEDESVKSLIPSSIGNPITAYQIKESGMDLGNRILNAEYEIVMPNIQGYSNMKVYQILNGKAEEIPAVYTNTTITVQVSELSLLVIAGDRYEPVVEPVQPEEIVNEKPSLITWITKPDLSGSSVEESVEMEEPDKEILEENEVPLVKDDSEAEENTETEVVSVEEKTSLLPIAVLGIAVVACLIFILWKRRKKDEEESEN